jgi:DNA repair ATPase RecN
MNTQGKVNKMMFSKTELSSVKVELNLINSFEDEFTNANKLMTKAYQSVFKIETAIQDMLNGYDAAGKSYLKANARYQELEQASKNLGIEVPSKIQSFKKAISEGLKEIDANSRELLKAKKMNFL